MNNQQDKQYEYAKGKFKKAIKNALEQAKKTQKKNIRKIKMLEKARKKTIHDNEKNLIEEQINSLKEQYSENKDILKNLITRMIYLHPNTKGAKKVANKMGYQTIEGYLQENNDISQDALKNFVSTFGDRDKKYIDSRENTIELEQMLNDMDSKKFIENAYKIQK